MLFWIVVLILAVVFLVGVFLSTRNLIWPHLLIWMGLFLLGVLFLAGAGFSMQTRITWQSRVDRVEDELATLQANLDRTQQAMHQLRHQMSLELHDRGRLWRNLAVANVAPNGAVTLDTRFWNLSPCVTASPEMGQVADEQAQPAADGPAAHGLESEMVVYAFQEIPASALPEATREATFAQAEEQRGGPAGPAGMDEAFYMDDQRKNYCRVPLAYVGQFRVANVGPGAVTIAPAFSAAGPQIQQWAGQAGQGVTWALYEQLPNDNPAAFAGLDVEQLRAIWEFPHGRFAAQGPELQAALAPFVRHGEVLSEPDDPQNTWVRVEFTRDYSVEVDAQGDAPLGETAFDPTGRAIVVPLRQGEPTRFQQGDTAVLDLATANQLQQEGVVTFVEYVYQRELRDYRQLFAELRRRQAALQDNLGVAQSILGSLAQSVTKLESQQNALQRRLEQLRHDQQGLRQSSAVITQYQQELEQQWDQMRQRLAATLRSNQQLRSELARP